MIACYIRIRSREGKRNKRMMCDCHFDPGKSITSIIIVVEVVLVVVVLLIIIIIVEMDDPSDACGENCLNRLLMIEWLVTCTCIYSSCPFILLLLSGSRCPCGEYCNNRRFQRVS